MEGHFSSSICSHIRQYFPHSSLRKEMLLHLKSVEPVILNIRCSLSDHISSNEVLLQKTLVWKDLRSQSTIVLIQIKGCLTGLIKVEGEDKGISNRFINWSSGQEVFIPHLQMLAILKDEQTLREFLRRQHSRSTYWITDIYAYRMKTKKTS